MNITLENKNNQCPSKPICHQTADVISVSDYEPAPTHTSSSYYQINVGCLFGKSLTHTDKNKDAVISSCQHKYAESTDIFFYILDIVIQALNSTKLALL